MITEAAAISGFVAYEEFMISAPAAGKSTDPGSKWLFQPVLGVDFIPPNT
jgi:hypothetical protein